MISAGQILEELYESIDAVTPDQKKAARRTLNLAYFDIASMASWAEMRRSITASDGDYLPADLIGVDAVYDDDETVYSARDKHSVSVKARDAVKRWYPKSVVSTPLASGIGVSINDDSTGISFSPALSITPNGEYIALNGTLGVWKMTSATALAETFRGDSIAGGRYVIRPPGTKQLGLMTEDGETDETAVTIDYWAHPHPIVDESSIILLPATEALMLMAMRRRYKITKRDLPRGVSLNDELATAISDLMARNPRYAGPSVPQGKDGRKNVWGRSLT